MGRAKTAAALRLQLKGEAGLKRRRSLIVSFSHFTLLQRWLPPPNVQEEQAMTGTPIDDRSRQRAREAGTGQPDRSPSPGAAPAGPGGSGTHECTVLQSERPWERRSKRPRRRRQPRGRRVISRFPCRLLFRVSFRARGSMRPLPPPSMTLPQRMARLHEDGGRRCLRAGVHRARSRLRRVHGADNWFPSTFSFNLLCGVTSTVL